MISAFLGNKWSCLPRKDEPMVEHLRARAVTAAKHSHEDEVLSYKDQEPVIIHKSLQWLLKYSSVVQDEARCDSKDTWVTEKSNYTNAELLDFLQQNKVPT